LHVKVPKRTQFLTRCMGLAANAELSLAPLGKVCLQPFRPIYQWAPALQFLVERKSTRAFSRGMGQHEI